MRTTAVYAGTFDPITLGHLDLIERSADIFERVVLAVAQATPKTTLFSVEERAAMAREVTAQFANVEVDTFNELLVKYARSKEAGILIRGLRAYSDFEYEFQMALTNRKLEPEIETLFMMPKEIHSYVSSSTVREVAQLGGDTSDFVPAVVQTHLTAKFAG
ncbi:MAG: pantetheine-phosphate adenylyltransferase [Verrucomicrobia bacterium]|nr:pantetheine-phosphate adenylyltransferase [Verrucomicrobiota bacterium]MBT7066811.1 pantetheine-phosphate adenylyltransferase [Verrucomicrobiota bacterium]MBT7702239.1 pantetheine-phosphate adenylyltransferase [Verrucomicrobiota bacterium]